MVQALRLCEEASSRIQDLLDDSNQETSCRDVGEEHCRAVSRSMRLRRRVYVHPEDPSRFEAGALPAQPRGCGSVKASFSSSSTSTWSNVQLCLPRGAAFPQLQRFKDRNYEAPSEHLNHDSRCLTRIQSIFLDGHFVIEHTARNRSGRFFNFNGTAGIWRRACLEDAGGWQSDTLTEDLDISYRAQLAGWRFVYLKDLAVPGELPVDMNGFKSQQHRWTKGSIQTGRKLLPAIFRSPFPWKVKVEALFHLTNNFSYLLVVLLALLIFPAIIIRQAVRLSERLHALRLFALLHRRRFRSSFYVSSPGFAGSSRPALEYMRIPHVARGRHPRLSNIRTMIKALVRKIVIQFGPRAEVPRVEGPRRPVSRRRRAAPLEELLRSWARSYSPSLSSTPSSSSSAPSATHSAFPSCSSSSTASRTQQATLGPVAGRNSSRRLAPALRAVRRARWLQLRWPSPRPVPSSTSPSRGSAV